jgi:CheY-like chemotaxis protein
MLLLVDDNLEQLELRQMVLAREGFTVATAGSAGEAMARCGGCQAVVMDLRLPSLADGLGLIRDLHARVPLAPIVVLAGLPEELRGRPEHALVHRVLRKGTGTGVLIDLLRSLGAPSANA